MVPTMAAHTAGVEIADLRPTAAAIAALASLLLR
jgi:hypothetical protein